MSATCYYYVFTGFSLLEEWTCAVTSRQPCIEGISSQNWRRWATPKRSTNTQDLDWSFLSMLWETEEEDPRERSARESTRCISKEQSFLKGELKNQNPCPENSEQLKVGCVYWRVPGDQTNEDSYTFMSFCNFYKSELFKIHTESGEQPFGGMIWTWYKRITFFSYFSLVKESM